MFLLVPISAYFDVVTDTKTDTVERRRRRDGKLFLKKGGGCLVKETSVTPETPVMPVWEVVG